MEWIAASRALRVRAVLPRTASRCSRNAVTIGASRSARLSALGCFPGAAGGEAEQQPERVPVGGDRAGAGLPLADQPAGEELLQDWCEVTHRRPPCGRAGRRLAASARGPLTGTSYSDIGITGITPIPGLFRYPFPCTRDGPVTWDD